MIVSCMQLLLKRRVLGSAHPVSLSKLTNHIKALCGPWGRENEWLQRAQACLITGAPSTWDGTLRRVKKVSS